MCSHMCVVVVEEHVQVLGEVGHGVEGLQTRSLVRMLGLFAETRGCDHKVLLRLLRPRACLDLLYHRCDLRHVDVEDARHISFHRCNLHLFDFLELALESSRRNMHRQEAMDGL